MKQEIESREAKGFLDRLSLLITTAGVGYLPLAPGTWGSIVGVIIYIAAGWIWTTAAALNFGEAAEPSAAFRAWANVIVSVLLLLYCLAGIWAAGRSTELFGDLDPSQAVVDEVIGQLIVFLFIPFTFSWQLILAGFLLFRIFDIWKPYPIDSLQGLPAGIGICADDILAGIYGGVCLAAVYAVFLSI